MTKRKKKQDKPHDYMFEMWGLPKPTPPDNTVKIHLDPSVVEAHLQKLHNESHVSDKTRQMLQDDKQEQLNKEAASGTITRYSTLATSSSLRKAQRIRRLSEYISRGLVKSVQAAMRVPLEDEISFRGLEEISPTEGQAKHSKKVIIEYLNILGKELIDLDTGKKVGSPEPLVLDYLGNVVRQKREYYKGDPLNGGVRIPPSKYREMKNKQLRDLMKGSSLT